MNRYTRRLIGLVVVLLVVGTAVFAFQRATRNARQGSRFFGWRFVTLWQSGELVREPVTDWSFIDDVPEVAIRTRTPLLISYWVTTYIARHDQQVYLFSDYAPPAQAPTLVFPQGRQWNRNLLRDPRVRVNILERHYDFRAYPLTDAPGDAENKVRAKEAFTSKYHRLKQQGVTGTTIPIVDLAVEQARPEATRPRMHFWRLEPL
jgi:hypothetical protein